MLILLALLAALATATPVDAAFTCGPGATVSRMQCRDGDPACDLDRRCDGQCLVRLCRRGEGYAPCPTTLGGPSFVDLLHLRRDEPGYSCIKLTGYYVKCKKPARCRAPEATCRAIIGEPYAGEYPCRVTGVRFRGGFAALYVVIDAPEGATSGDLPIAALAPGTYPNMLSGGQLYLPVAGSWPALAFASRADAPDTGAPLQITLTEAKRMPTGAYRVHGVAEGEFRTLVPEDRVVSVRIEF